MNNWAPFCAKINEFPTNSWINTTLECRLRLQVRLSAHGGAGEMWRKRRGRAQTEGGGGGGREGGISPNLSRIKQTEVNIHDSGGRQAGWDLTLKTDHVRWVNMLWANLLMLLDWGITVKAKFKSHNKENSCRSGVRVVHSALLSYSLISPFILLHIHVEVSR